MKKIFSFLAMFCLLFMVGGTAAVAQDSDVAWEVDDSSPVTAIETGVNYALRKGTNATFNPSAYLSSDGIELTSLNVTAVYQFEQDGTVTTDGETLPLYILKSVALDQYLGEGGGYVRSRADAFHFTALLAEGYPEDTEWTSLTEMQRRCAVREEPQPGVVGQTFVFASAEPGDDGLFTFMSYYGNPGFWNYFDTNAWFVFPINERPKTASEKMQDAYDNLFGGAGVDETTFPVGSAPGCISQELFNQLLAAYNAYFDVTGNSSATDEEMNAVTDLLNAANEALEAGRIQVTPGYYIMLSQRSHDAAYDDGANIRCTSNWTVPETMTASAARYIWQVVDAGNGRYNLRNLETGRYINAGTGTSAIFTSGEEASATFNFPIIKGRFFAIVDQNGNRGHCDGSFNFVQWNSDGEGNQWEFVVVSQDQVEAMLPEIEHNQLLDNLADLLTDAKGAQVNYLYDSDVTFDDQYASAGLADPALMTTNAPESNEGYAVADQFTRLSDGNLTTYFHSNWSGGENDPSEGYHWVQVDLGKAVQNLFIKFSERHNNSDGSPRYVAFVTNDDPEAEVWTDTLRKDSVFYDYATNFSAGVRDSSTAVMRISFKKPVQHLRFAVIYTNANGIHGGGPCWYVSEMRFYEDGGDNPRLALIPQEVKDELARSLAAAKTELEAGAATQATIDALQAAWEAFVAAYPDPRPLASLIADARAMTEGVFEGDQVGYYADGSVETLNAKLDEIEAAMGGATLSLQQLADYTAQVNAAVLAFKNSFNIPEEGYYRIISTSPSGAGNGSYIYATANSEAATARWAYAGDENIDSRLDAIWYMSRNEDGTVSFRNVATGLYLGNNFEDAEDPASVGLSVGLNYSLEPDTFRIGYAGTEGLMNIEMYDGRWINAAPGGGIVNWNGANSNSCFDFEPVDESVFLGEAYVNFPAAGMQIMCLPYDVDGGWLMPMAHKVLGMRTGADGQTYIEMSLYEEGETLTAGTPFVINPEEETSLYAMLTAMTLDEVMNGNHGYEPVEANGMVSAPSAVVPGQGNGLLVDGRVVILAEDESIVAGSGYFTDRIPATDEVGDLSIPVDGVINAIGGATLTDAAAEVDVYTLSGVKVRAKVKASEATKGLPAGLYIVGGQKVLVK